MFHIMGHVVWSMLYGRLKSILKWPVPRLFSSSPKYIASNFPIQLDKTVSLLLLGLIQVIFTINRWYNFKVKNQLSGIVNQKNPCIDISKPFLRPSISGRFFIRLSILFLKTSRKSAAVAPPDSTIRPIRGDRINTS